MPRKYDYELFKINKSYEKLDEGSLEDLYAKYYLCHGHILNNIKDEIEVYGTYLIKRTPRNITKKKHEQII